MMMNRKKPAEFDIEKGGTREWYTDNSQKPLVKLGTKLGKRAAKDFIKALDMRMKGRNDISSDIYFTDPFTRAAHACLMFFKYLGQEPAFDEFHDPQKPIPILLIWNRFPDGRVTWTHNNLDNFPLHQYRLAKEFVKFHDRIGFRFIDRVHRYYTKRKLKHGKEITKKESEKLKRIIEKVKIRYGKINLQRYEYLKNVRENKSETATGASRGEKGRDNLERSKRRQVQKDPTGQRRG
jgi:hypothetical protein